jgi:UDP-glucose 4-epimerase
VSVNVFLTGASGFIGSYVLRHLLDRGSRVAVLLRAKSDSWRIADVIDSASRIHGDLSDTSTFEPAFAKFGPEAVVHLAWGGVQGRHRNDLLQLRNLHDTIELLNATSRCDARHFIGLGSQAEYGPCEGLVAEGAPTHPTTLYGATKLSACHLTEQICRLAGMRFAWLRLFSAYGPRDDAGWLIPSTILGLLRGERPPLTKGEQLWDYIHADDVAAAICDVASAPGAGGVFNIGSGETATIRSIVERVRDLVAPGAALGFGELDYRPDQVMHLQADIGRLRAAIGWEPKVILSNGLAQTAEWFREQRGRYQATREEIAG